MKLKELIGKKLKCQAGESLGEVLIALLIAALAMTMLASVISSASRIITQSKSRMADYYSELNKLADPPESGNSALTITITDKSTPSQTYNLMSSTMTVNCRAVAANKGFQNTPVVAYWLSKDS